MLIAFFCAIFCIVALLLDERRRAKQQSGILKGKDQYQ